MKVRVGILEFYYYFVLFLGFKFNGKSKCGSFVDRCVFILKFRCGKWIDWCFVVEVVWYFESKGINKVRGVVIYFLLVK